MEVVTTDSGAELREGDAVVATITGWDGELEVPPPPSAVEVDSAIDSFDLASYAEPHPFPTCFTCGPDRAEGDGLRLFPAPIGPGSRVGWTWTPDASLAGPDGEVSTAVMWAALDCPGGHTWLADTEAAIDAPVVLGRLAAKIHRRARVGESCVVAGWQLGRDGRKLASGTAVWSEAGELLGFGRATWVVLDAAQAAAFTSSG